MMKIIPLLLPTTLAGFVLAGCAVGPDYKPPKPEAPASWVSVTNATATAGSVATAAPAELTAWWKKFDDPGLISLIDEGFRSNLDVKIAEASLRAARASKGMVAGALWPSLTGAGSYSRSKVGTAPQTDTFSTGLDAVWELD